MAIELWIFFLTDEWSSTSKVELSLHPNDNKWSTAIISLHCYHSVTTCKFPPRKWHQLRQATNWDGELYQCQSIENLRCKKLACSAFGLLHLKDKRQTNKQTQNKLASDRSSSSSHLIGLTFPFSSDKARSKVRRGGESEKGGGVNLINVIESRFGRNGGRVLVINNAAISRTELE